MQLQTLNLTNDISGKSLLPFDISTKKSPEDSPENSFFTQTLDGTLQEDQGNNSIDLNMEIKNIIQKLKSENLLEPKLENPSEEDSSEIEPELVIISLLDKIISDLSDVQSKEDLIQALKDKDISDNNISGIMQFLGIDNISQAKTDQDVENIIQNSVENLQASSEILRKGLLARSSLEDNSKKSFVLEKISNADSLEVETGKNISSEQAKSENTEPKANADGKIEINLNSKNDDNQQAEADKRIQDLIKKFNELKASNTENVTEKGNTNTTNAAGLTSVSEKIQQTLENRFEKQIENNKDQKLEESLEESLQEMESASRDNKSSEFKSIESKFSETKADLNHIKQHTASSTEDNNLFSNISNKSENANFQEVLNNKQADSVQKQIDLYKMVQEANTKEQVNVAIKQMKLSNTKQIEIKLHPEELGSVQIKLDLSDSVNKGIITVENSEVARHLAQNLKDIFEGFKKSGFDLDSSNIVIEVDNNQQQKGKKSNQHYFDGNNQNSEKEESISVQYDYEDNSKLDINV